MAFDGVAGNDLADLIPCSAYREVDKNSLQQGVETRGSVMRARATFDESQRSLAGHHSACLIQRVRAPASLDMTRQCGRSRRTGRAEPMRVEASGGRCCEEGERTKPLPIRFSEASIFV